MKQNKILRILVMAGLILTLVALPFMAACAKPAPAPAPTPAPAPAPAPTPTPAPAPPPAQPTEPVTLRYNWETTYGRGGSFSWPYRPGGRFEWLLTRYSDGLLKLDYKEKLFGLFESVFAVGDGRIDMGTQSIPPVSGTYPLLDYGSIPGFIADVPDSGYEWAESFLDPRMMEIWDKYTRPDGFKIIGGSISDSSNIQWSNIAFRTVEDFKGVKVRTSGKTQTSALAALGASPVTLSMAEVEEALVRGTVDSVTTGKAYGSRKGLLKIVKYASVWPITPVFSGIFAVNVKVWDNLDPFFQEALLKAAAQMTREAAAAVEQAHIDYTLWIQASECELVIPEKGEVEKGMALMGPVVEEWIGFSGPLAKDVLRVASDYATGPIAELAKSIIAK